MRQTGGIMNSKALAGAAVLAAGIGLAACTSTVTQSPAPTVTVTHPATPAPATTVVRPPATTPPASYAQDITNAGIVAPVDWINSMGERLCAAWRSGRTTADTDQILLAGGLHADHLAAFDHITSTDLCPGAIP